MAVSPFYSSEDLNRGTAGPTAGFVVALNPPLHRPVRFDLDKWLQPRDSRTVTYCDEAMGVVCKEGLGQVLETLIAELEVAVPDLSLSVQLETFQDDGTNAIFVYGLGEYDFANQLKMSEAKGKVVAKFGEKATRFVAVLE